MAAYKKTEAVRPRGHAVKLDYVKIRRDPKITLLPFTDYFQGFEKVGTVKAIFEKPTEVLANLKVEFFSLRRGYMGVSDVDGHIFVNADYLRNGDERSLYLDVIHELVHVKQFMDGRPLFDESYQYVERPTELEAYGHTVKEAKRLGMSDEEIFEYLKMDRLTEEEHRKLAANLGLRLK